MSKERPQRELPTWLWLWLPPVMIVLVYGFRILDDALYEHLFRGEIGVIELATPVASFIGLGFGILALTKWRLLPDRKAVIWIAMVSFGAFYQTGEEISWGQQLYHWATPQEMAQLNDQDETNLHNISSWFDQKPRLLLELWVLIGGLILPLKRGLWRQSAPRRDDWRDWFWPTWVCFPTALLTILVRMPERLIKWGLMEHHLKYNLPYSEVQEYYFALFLCIYLASVYTRLQSQAID